MRGVACFTVIALLICYDEFNHKGLLKHRVLLHFFLNCYFDFNSSGVGFGPNKSSVQKLHSFQAFDVLQAQGKQLSTFRLDVDPGWPQISVAVTTMIKDNTSWNTFSDVNLALEAINASVCCVWQCHYSTHATSYPLSN